MHGDAPRARAAPLQPPAQRGQVRPARRTTADVAVGAERADGAWRIVVADRGIGIEPEHAKRVFRMFHRLHNADEYAGTGIGLSIAAKVVEQHGGEIGVEPNPGGGSRFWFTLPDRDGRAEAGAT